MTGLVPVIHAFLPFAPPAKPPPAKTPPTRQPNFPLAIQVCLGIHSREQPGPKEGQHAALAPQFPSTPLPAPHRRRPVRPQDTPAPAAAGRRAAKLRPGPALPARDRLRRLLRAPPAAEEAVPRQPVAPRPHLVVRQQADRLDRPPQAPLPPLRDRPRPLHRRPRQRRLEGRGRALQARPPRRGTPAGRAPPVPRKPPAVLDPPPRARRPQRPRTDAAAVRARALADDRPSRLARILAPSRPPRGRARPRTRPRPPYPPRDPAP